MDLNDWFDKGITIEAYEQELSQHKNHFNHIYHSFHMPEDAAFIKDTADKNLRVLVIAEPWCGHCMLDVPILKRIAEATGMTIRVLLRDTHPELMDMYETGGKRIIPIFIFIDEAGRQVAKWGPRAPKVADIHNDMLRSLPSKSSGDYDTVFKEKISLLTAQFSSDDSLWHHVYENIKETIKASKQS